MSRRPSPSRRSRSFGALARLNPFAKSDVDRAMTWKRGCGRRLGVESLEDRRMLAVLIGPADDLDMT